MGRRTSIAVIYTLDDNRQIVMNNLHVFGDSFSEDFPTAWPSRLAKLQNLKISNQSHGGSSIEWSGLKLHNTKFNNGDVVIFVLSSIERFDIKPFITTAPSEAWRAKHVDTLNDANLEWYIRSRSDKLLDLKPALYTSWICCLSQQHPDVKFIVISGFADSKGSSVISKTSNYIMLDSISLNEISHYEVNELKLNPYMLYNICGHDPRINHLSNINLDKLANSINDVINTWDGSNYRLDRFVKNVIDKHVSTLDDLHNTYVSTGIFDKQWIEKNTIPVTQIHTTRFHMVKQWILEKL